MKKLISVIVPVYNVAEFLPRTINSILGQTYKKFELILVDDGSPDNSGQICDNYAAKDNRIRVFHVPNGGAGAARKYGVGQANGRWIMFVDGDDTIPETTLSNLLAINKRDYDITIGTLNINDRVVFEHKKTGLLSHSEYIEALLLGQTSVGPVAKLFKKYLFDVHWSCPKHITNNEDLLMLLSIATKVNTVFISNDVICYNYLYREGSVSKSRGMNTEAWLDLFDEIKYTLRYELDVLSVRRAFLNYKLCRLSMVPTFKGYWVNPSIDRVCEIINEANNETLNKSELKMLKVIQSVNRQRILYMYHFIRNMAKKVIRKS